MKSGITRRRQLMVSSVIGLVTFLSGCTGGKEASDGIEIEYSVLEPRTYDEVPETVVEHSNPEGFRWIVVEFELITGSFDANDIMELTQVDVQGDSHFTRSVEITSPDEELLTSSDDSYMMDKGLKGKRTTACQMMLITENGLLSNWRTSTGMWRHERNNNSVDQRGKLRRYEQRLIAENGSQRRHSTL